MTARSNGRQEKAGGQPGNFSAPTKEHNAILPDCPAASKLREFVIEQLPTPLREPATVVQILVRFDAKQPLPDDVAAQVMAAIHRARNRALTADCMAPATRAFWEGFDHE